MLTDKLTFSSDDGKTMTMDSHITSAHLNLIASSSTIKATARAAMAAPPPEWLRLPAPLDDSPRQRHPNFRHLEAERQQEQLRPGTPGPASQTDVIEDNEPSVKIAEDQKGGMMGDMNLTSNFDTTGKETTSPGMGGAAVTSTAHWDGVALVVNSKASFQGNDVKIKDPCPLSCDGKTPTRKSLTYESGMGNFDSTSVYDKQ